MTEGGKKKKRNLGHEELNSVKTHFDTTTKTIPAKILGM